MATEKDGVDSAVRESVRCRVAIFATALLVIEIIGCAPPEEPQQLPLATPGLELQHEPLATARSGFQTRLTRSGPSPQSEGPIARLPGAIEVHYRSGELTLSAFVTPDPGDRRRRPAVLFLHGGFRFGEGHWQLAKPFRDAGFVVMTPMLRGENGQAGNFTLFYDEVADVLAAADALASLPYVDANQLYICGHSVGGTLAMLAAMISPKFRAGSSLSGSPDLIDYLRGRPELAPFELSNLREFQLRSPVAFATSFRCPMRLYFGEQEYGITGSTERTAFLARQTNIDVASVEVAGDHFSSVPEGIRQSVRFFQARGVSSTGR